MEQVELKVEKREIKGKQVKQIRQRGAIPAVVYGRGVDSVSIEVDGKSFLKAISTHAGLNVIISIKVDKKAFHVIAHEIQRNPMNGNIIHIDFSYVNMKEKLHTKVPVEITGLPIGVKEEEGVLVHGLSKISIECLPADIPDKFVLDVSGLKINQSLLVSEMKVDSAKIKILDDGQEMLALVAPPTKEEEVVAPAPTPEEAAAAAAGVPVEGEEAPAAEGEAKAEGKAEGKAEDKDKAKAKESPPKKEK